MGVIGAWRPLELNLMETKDVQDLGSPFLVTVSDIKTKIDRCFTISGNFYHICKQYLYLRPDNCRSTSFFLHFQKGRCTGQKIDTHKFATMGRQIAEFLELPNPELYSGHHFRKSSAMLQCVNSERDTVQKIL